MKIERAESKFEPVVITLESQEEVDQMYALVSSTDFDNEIDITQELFNHLDQLRVGQGYSMSTLGTFTKV